jgi:hypothetical protein
MLGMSHRAALYPEENLCVGCLKATFCWGCSIGQVHRDLLKRRQQAEQPLEGNALLGLLYAPHVMR